MDIRLREPDDFHLHLRQGEMLETVAPLSAGSFRRGIVMPNTIPPVSDAGGLDAYCREISLAAPGFEPLMTFKLIPGLEPDEISRMAKAGALAGKYYPAGATTNAEDGFSEIKAAFPLFHVLQSEGLVLSIHGEDPDKPILEREAAFLQQVQIIIDNFPRLRIVLEHLSCRESVEAVRAWPERVAATVTAHHLAFSLEDLIGGALNHNLFCKPVVKGLSHQRALVEAAVSGESKFFFGTDSAPHSDEAKCRGAAGSFTAPVAMPLIAEVFSKAGKLEALEDFTSRFGAEFYRLPLNKGELLLSRKDFHVPGKYDGVVPLCAGQVLPWRVADRSAS